MTFDEWIAGEKDRGLSQLEIDQMHAAWDAALALPGKNSRAMLPLLEELAAERAVSDRLLKAMTDISEGEARHSYFKDKSVCPHNKYEHENCEACLMEFANTAIAEVEAMRKEQP